MPATIPDPAQATAAPTLGFDFLSYGRPEAPRWLWQGILEQGTVNLLSGAKSVMKSYLGHGLTAALLLGHESYLGYEISGRRVLVIDAENPHGVPRARLYALGVREEHWANLRYVVPGANGSPEIGARGWTNALTATVDDFDPDLILIDGSLSATIVEDVSDTKGIKHLYNALRAATQGHRAATLVYHHERKRDSQFGRGDADMATIGSVYWLNLADAGYALQRKDQEKLPVEGTDDVRLITTSELEVTKDPRVGVPIKPVCFAVDSVFGPDGLLKASEACVVDDPEVHRLMEALIEHDEPEIKSGTWAKAAGYRDSSDSQYDRIRRRAIAAGYARKLEEKTGYYAATELARGKFRNPALS